MDTAEALMLRSIERMSFLVPIVAALWFVVVIAVPPSMGTM
jgi:hypothetical protein